MKKFIIALVATLICSTGFAQKIRTSFFGLEFGESLTKDKVIEAVGDHGTLVSESDDSYSFLFVTCDDIFASFAVICLDENHVFDKIIFSASSNDEQTADSMKQMYSRLLNYPFESLPGGTDAIYYCDNDGNTVTINNSRSTNGFYDTILTFIYHAVDSVDTVPFIQNEFFGLKMGQRLSEAIVKNAIGGKGEFAEKTVDGSSIIYMFTSVQFAGKKWDFGNFVVNSSGELYYFRVYDSFDDNSWNEDQRNDARKLFDSYKTKLESKYGTGVENEDGNISYRGDNNILLLLDNRRSQSRDGYYRRYVEIDYIELNLYNQTQNAEDDEL